MRRERGQTGCKKSGFTLIELLVVNAIIAVLLAILMPAMRKVKEIARENICRSNLKNIGLVVAMYLDDFERTLPPRLSANQFFGVIRRIDSGSPAVAAAIGAFGTKTISKRRKSLGVRVCKVFPKGSYKMFPIRYTGDKPEPGGR